MGSRTRDWPTSAPDVQHAQQTRSMLSRHAAKEPGISTHYMSMSFADFCVDRHPSDISSCVFLGWGRKTPPVVPVVPSTYTKVKRRRTALQHRGGARALLVAARDERCFRPGHVPGATHGTLIHSRIPSFRPTPSLAHAAAPELSAPARAFAVQVRHHRPERRLAWRG